MKQLNRNKTCFPLFDKIIVIKPVAEVYGESNSEQRMRGVAKRELIGRNGVKFVYLMPPKECWTGSQQI